MCADSIQVKCHRCLQKGLPCSKPSPKSRRSPSRTLDSHTTKVATGQSQPPPQIILTQSVPVGSSSYKFNFHSTKKRDRPSKIEMEQDLEL
jgi:hypothetical protein